MYIYFYLYEGRLYDDQHLIFLSLLAKLSLISANPATTTKKIIIMIKHNKSAHMRFPLQWDCPDRQSKHCARATSFGEGTHCSSNQTLA